MDVEYSTEQMLKIFQDQLSSIVHRIIMPCFLYNMLMPLVGTQADSKLLSTYDFGTNWAV